jgi:tRNA threonylcarbamoyladenosine biosynthesis protein TsaB
VIILSVHTSSPHLGLAVARDGEIIAEHQFLSSREHLENIAPGVQAVLAESHLSLNTVDGLGVAVGPGSFSGIRVGLSFVKGVMLALGKPAAAVSSLEVLAKQALRDGETGTAVIDARRGEIYVATYRCSGEGLTLLGPPRLIPAADFSAYAEGFSSRLVLAGDPVVEALAEACPVAQRSMTLVPSAGVCARIAWERLVQGRGDAVHTLAPLYIRRSDAEEKRGPATGGSS